jgi:hypothetical protein
LGTDRVPTNYLTFSIDEKSIPLKFRINYDKNDIDNNIKYDKL